MTSPLRFPVIWQCELCRVMGKPMSSHCLEQFLAQLRVKRENDHFVIALDSIIHFTLMPYVLNKQVNKRI